MRIDFATKTVTLEPGDDMVEVVLGDGRSVICRPGARPSVVRSDTLRRT